MTEILSQDEIDALLTAISTGEADTTDYTAVKEQRKVKIYDFRRPDKFSKDQIRTLQMMHETFARLTTTALSAQLRALVSVHVASVDQLTYEEFIRSIPNPTTLAVINMDPLKGSAVLEIDPSITFTIIDKLFGGTGESTKISRELTDIELSVMEGIIVRILGNLREAWSNVIDLRPRLGNIETNPQFAQIVPPNDMVVLVTLETKVGEVEGMMNLCIPYITIEPVISKLSAQYWYSSIRKGATDENAAIIQSRLESVELPIIVEVGEIE
ncbi:MAG TPA: flagellar motor switch protein FliM, partial [Spirochaetota bacterium]|nr:flagellar motor switch protein FliM [Spirochaetota bacterium]